MNFSRQNLKVMTADKILYCLLATLLQDFNCMESELRSFAVKSSPDSKANKENSCSVTIY
jgi:hypothetical protein